MSAPMAKYLNPGNDHVEFEVGTTPGQTVTYSCEPGGEMEGPAAYEKHFKRYGLVLADDQGVPTEALEPVAPFDQTMPVVAEPAPEPSPCPVEDDAVERKAELAAAEERVQAQADAIAAEPLFESDGGLETAPSSAPESAPVPAPSKKDKKGRKGKK